MSPTNLELVASGRRWRVVLTRAAHISIPLRFTGAQPSFFGAPPARAEPLVAGQFIGDVAVGGSCNCATYTLTPHCNGTHTEGVGHIVEEAVGVCELVASPIIAALLTVSPVEITALSIEHADPPSLVGDHWITVAQLQEAATGIALDACQALVVRTLPNPPDKRWRNHSAPGYVPAYFSIEAMQWMVRQGIEHLVTDLPSVDRADDAGRLNGHRIFWGLPAGSTRLAEACRAQATITELAYIDDAVTDGLYLLNLQLAPFASDAAPSRPILYPLEMLPQ